MIVLLLFFFKNVAGQHLSVPGEVMQCAGRSVHVVCRYHPFYRDNVKYWCKGYYFNYCTVLVRTSQSREGYDAPQIRDDKRGGFFTIRMKNVQTEDSGWYWCAIERVSRHVSRAVQLIITAEGAQHCSVTETPQKVKQATTEAPTTSTTITTSSSSSSSSTSHTTDLTVCHEETRPGEFHVTQLLSNNIWMITRWMVFMGMCLYLTCFITCFKIWVRRRQHDGH